MPKKTHEEYATETVAVPRALKEAIDKTADDHKLYRYEVVQVWCHAFEALSEADQQRHVQALTT